MEVRIHEADNKLWASTQNNLGITYCHRIRGDKYDNLKQALKAFNSALEVYKDKYFPDEWAWTQNEIGYAYLNMEKGDKADNLKQAIKAFNSALTGYTRDKSLEDWARTQNNLGNAYLQAGEIEEAIDAFNSVLKALMDDNHISQQARIKNNLGSAYLQRTQRNKEKNLKLAFKAFNSNSHNLGSAYLQIAQQDKEKNLKLAFKAFNSNLQVYNREDFPEELAITQAYIGYIYKCTNKNEEAYKAFNVAIDITEYMRSEIIYGSDIEVDKQKLAEKCNFYYQSIIEVCLKLGLKQPEYFARAIEYAEHSKARNLVELLDNKSLYPQEKLYRDCNQEDYEKHCKNLDDLRRKISSAYRQKEGKEALIKIGKELKKPIKEIEQIIDGINEKLKDLRRERDEALNEISKIDPDFKFTQQVSKICFEEIQSLIKKGTAIVEWYITNNKIITFIITRNEEQQSKQPPLFWTFSSDKDLDKLKKWYKEYLMMYYASEQKEKFNSELTGRLGELAKILHIKEILSPIAKTCNRLILVPHHFLHLLPLHALPFPKEQDKCQQQDECLLDTFQGGVSYAPSCQLLQRSQRLQRTEFNNLFAVKNSKNNLHYDELEVDVIKSFFAPQDKFKNEDIDEDTLKKSEKLHSSHCCHFACHGEFNLASPLESALLLPKNSERKSSDKNEKQEEDGRLTLAEIFGLTLDKCRLVTLSACETAMVDPDSISDEYIGLPSGFLVAGSPSIVASFWAADDKSTAILMIKFYENLSKHREERKHRKELTQLEEGAVAIALNQAQIWLRDLTKVKWEQWIEESSLGLTYKISLPAYFPSQAQGEKQSFCEPYHWAAFCAIGQ
ncbi:MAG: CHAT domain-containing protein [Nostoc sp. DedVER02]|uniref:CHAT domain-containing protein n=1 Tax=unclassified Nostoc TaxID=2593658 RepID=UPI002AD42AA6|nr:MULTISPECIES: CHAT domain-containing protein [unclassified Nostoc]